MTATEPDLFAAPAPAKRYPDRPGFKANGTSEAAAKAVEAKAATLRRKVLEALAHRSMTADEVAAFLGEDILSIRPRVAELNKTRMIFDTGECRPSSRGKSSIVWGI